MRWLRIDANYRGRLNRGKSRFQPNRIQFLMIPKFICSLYMYLSSLSCGVYKLNTLSQVAQTWGKDILEWHLTCIKTHLKLVGGVSRKGGMDPGFSSMYYCSSLAHLVNRIFPQVQSWCLSHIWRKAKKYCRSRKIKQQKIIIEVYVLIFFTIYTERKRTLVKGLPMSVLINGSVPENMSKVLRSPSPLHLTGIVS